MSEPERQLTSVRPIADDVSGLMARLESRELTLTGRINTMIKERAKVRASLASLRNLRNDSTNPDRLSTRNVVRQYLLTIKPGAPVTPDDVMAFADTVNWTSTAIDRRQAFSTVLVRLGNSGELTKIGHGKYQKPGKGK